ncbi:MAG: helix-turn-helix transcriptional regulator [Gammaproteobacteria bacterium]|nr:helix-turn-helix transcriptional regulator [Gammaproteobacteria bacterium]
MSGTAIRNSLRRLRFEAGEMTQQELADRARITRQTVIAIEAGKYAPSLEVAFRLARVFGQRLEDVFSLDEPTVDAMQQGEFGRKMNET